MIPLQKYKLEFMLHTYNTSLQEVRNSLAEFGDALSVMPSAGPGEKGNNFQVCINTEDPTVIFDICSQFGRIRSVKINDEVS